MRSLCLPVIVCIVWLMPVTLSAQTQPSSSIASQSFYALGEVNRRGMISFPKDEKVTVMDLLQAAGGQTPLANMNRAVVRRTENGEAKLIDVDFASLFRKGLASANIPMQSGDMLLIPARGHKMFLIDPISLVGWLLRPDLQGLRIFFLH